jgi:glutathione peroxidase
MPEPSAGVLSLNSLLFRIMRTFLLTLFTAIMTPATFAQTPLLEIPLKTIEKKDTTLKTYQGKVLLVVNVASQCGLTPQYAGLEALWQKYKDKGLVVLGFPCNDFGGQEPEDEAGIQTFCSSNYNVTFPLFAKLGIKTNPHALYTELMKSGDVSWNFTKFLVGKDGKTVKHFDSNVEPDSAELIAAIEAALK